MSGKGTGSIGRFVPTQWSMVARAGHTSAGGKRESLGALLRIYLPALRAHLRLEKKLEAGRVEDLLQGFVADKIVEQNLIARADRNKGKFRSFLLTALNRYVMDQGRLERAGKRGGKMKLGMEVGAEVAGPGEERSASFDVTWAKELIAEALGRMRQECEDSGRGQLWEMFDLRVVRPAFDGVEAIPYGQLIERFGIETPLAASNLLTTAKRMFGRHLRAVAGEYAGGGKGAEEEIEELKEILAGAGA